MKYTITKTFILILVAIIHSCAPATKRITVELSPEHVILDGKKIGHLDFSSEFKAVVEMKLSEGLKKNELIVVLRVHPETKRGAIADVEAELRKLNVRRVEYSVRNESRGA